MAEKKLWTDKDIRELIDVYKDYRGLWDTSHKDFKNRPRRQDLIECLAWKFDTDPSEISRKLHNLRTQYLQHAKKMRKRIEENPEVRCSWPYFELMTFIQPIRVNCQTGPSSEDEVNTEVSVASSLILEDDPLSLADDLSSVDEPPVKKVRSEVTMRVEPEKLVIKHQLDQHPALQESASSSSHGTDPDQIFGDYVASELRQIRNFTHKRKLKRLINEALIQVGELEDQIESSSSSHIQMDVKPEMK